MTHLSRSTLARCLRLGVAGLLAVAGILSPLPADLPGRTAALAADPSSDIPGIPLPSTVVTGLLGGPIYDVVYRVPVPPGSILIASLSGTSGTDFDIYLYDSTATTVVTTAGLVVKSIGPTSTESITYPSRSGGTYYLDLNGATDVEGSYRLAVQVVPDQTPPTVSMTLADGRGATNQATVAVTLVGTDDLSGVAEMAFSTDGVTYGTWAPFRATSSWTFPPGDGEERLWVEVTNGVGLVSAPARATVTLDTVSPGAITIDPAPGTTVVGLRPRFSVVFDEAIDPASWSRFGLIVQGATGVLVDGSYSYDASSRTGSFVPASSLLPGATYVVTIGAVTDVAGNFVAPRGSWTVVALSPSSIDARALPGAIAVGGSATIRVVLTGAPLPAVLQVAAVDASSGTGLTTSALLMQGGPATTVVTPARNMTYRLSYAGTGGVAPATEDVRVLVRRSVALVGRSSATVSTARVGRSLTLVAAVGPAAGGVSVSFRLYRYDAARRAWVYAGSRGRGTDPAGRASFAWSPPSSGSFYWRVAVASTADYANNVSPVYRFAVSR